MRASPTYTDRLTIRPFVEDDLEDLFALQSREDVARYLLYEPRTREETREALAKRLPARMEKEGDALTLAVTLTETGQLLGEVSLFWLSEHGKQGELGFTFHPDHQGKGYAKEASLEMLRLGFEDFGWHRIIGQCDPRNDASWRLMERLGMRQEAHFQEFEIFKGEWGNLYVYAMLAAEWHARSAQTKA